MKKTEADILSLRGDGPLETPWRNRLSKFPIKEEAFELNAKE